MLLAPFEKQLNLPAFMIWFRNSQKVFNHEVIGQEAIDFSGLEVLIHNKSQYIRTLPG